MQVEEENELDHTYALSPKKTMRQLGSHFLLFDGSVFDFLSINTVYTLRFHIISPKERLISLYTITNSVYR